MSGLARHVVIVGGGGTGLALAYELALHGVPVTLFEQGELTSGTTGRHHGQLHCGARYAVTDPATARECYEESVILRRIAPQSIEYNGGLFVALTAEDEEFLPAFLDGCAAAGIPAEVISGAAARDREPALSAAVRTAVTVPDGTIDAFRLPMQFAAAARRLGARILPFHRVVDIDVERNGGGRVTARRLGDGYEITIRAGYVVNAGGAWAGMVAERAGFSVAVTPSPGAMLAFTRRATDAVISRLHPPGDGDILVPQRRLSIIGSTQRLAEDPDDVSVRPEDRAFLRGSGAEMVPALRDADEAAAWAAPRPLAGRVSGSTEGDLRGLSRDFSCIPHAPGFMSVVGGKATVLRRMAEQAAAEICSDLGVSHTDRSRTLPLDDYRDFYRGNGDSV